MTKATFSNARILIADDEAVNILLLEQILKREGYLNIQSTTDPRKIFSLYAEAEPDLILLDLMMPEMNGFEVMERLGTLIPEGNYLPILVLTADATPQVKLKALSAQATDFLTKPFDSGEVALRIGNLLTTRYFHLQLSDQNRTLDARVRERTADLSQAQEEILSRLARAAEFRDDDTGQHTQRVAHSAALLAKNLGLPAEQIELLQKAAPLHDVGKIGISDLILLKPGKLTDEEFGIIKTHTTVGAELLAGGCSELVHVAEVIAATHHERWDGRGYPCGLAGVDIPVEGRIVAIADVFDALTHERPYKKAWSIEEAMGEIQKQGGHQFDPAYVESFVQIYRLLG